MPAPKKPFHHSFAVKYSGLAYELKTKLWVSAPACLSNGVTRDFKEFICIWDTGATHSVITQEIIEALNLTSTGRATVNGINSVTEVNTYIVDIGLPNNVLVPVVMVTESCINSPGIQAIIGMDIIQHGDFSISNHDQRTLFSFCIPPHENRVDLVEKSSYVNKRNKHSGKIVHKD